jgi:hypothetical protein
MRDYTDVPQRFFLRRKLYYHLTLAVIATTLFSWFNINSYLIILLLFCRLVDGSPRLALKSAFTNMFFLAYSAIFLIEFAGLFYTHHLFTGWRQMESKATLVAISFIFCAGPFTDNDGYRKIFTGYCLLLVVGCVYCLSMAFVEYHWQHRIDVFFYHELTSPVGVNAVFFSGYLLVAIFFLLFSGLAPGSVYWGHRYSATFANRLRILLIAVFAGMMVLLSSRLMLFLLGAGYAIYIGRGLPKMKWAGILSFGLLIVLSLGVLAFTDNPVSRRYRELSPESLTRGVLPGAASSDINGISLRLFMWRAAFDILRENHAWIFGVSGGDSQELLDQKYLAAGMSQGYLRYNFHNEYVEVLVHSGIAGWAVFMLAVAAMVFLARSAGTAEAALTIAMLLVLCLTESSLEMQHGLFLSVFFPMLNLCRLPARDGDSPPLPPGLYNGIKF